MNKINDVFHNGKNSVRKNQIKSILIDWETHPKGILNIAESIEPNFKVTDENKMILKLLLLYFTGNPYFISEFRDLFGQDGSLNKGIMLIGGVGTGKSLLFRIFKEYTMNILQANSFQMFNAIDIIDSVNIEGVKYLDLFTAQTHKKNASTIKYYIDDIAAKSEEVNTYGTKVNVIEQLLSFRYNVFLRHGTITHCSSNKYPNELYNKENPSKRVYDLRTVDRMKEMFNVIELKGSSFRK